MSPWFLLIGLFVVSLAFSTWMARTAERSERWRPLVEPRLNRLALLFLSLLVLAVFVAQWLTDDPGAIVDLGRQLERPTWDHPMGLDRSGRDVLGRLVFGARSSLTTATVGVLVSGILGVTTGLLAGLAGGLWDRVLMRTVDAALSIPRLFLILVVVSLWGTVTPLTLGVLLGASGWFVTSRLVRADVLSLRERAFLRAARTSGTSPWRLALIHTAPHVAPTAIVSMALGLAGMILIEAGLGYLGVGVSDLDPSWGGMIREATSYTRSEPWIVLIPGITITLTVVSINALGDGLRTVLNPRART